MVQPPSLDIPSDSFGTLIEGFIVASTKVEEPVRSRLIRVASMLGDVYDDLEAREADPLKTAEFMQTIAFWYLRTIHRDIASGTPDNVD